MEYGTDRYIVQLIDEPTYTFNSTDNLRVYDREYVFTNEPSTITSIHGIMTGSASAVLGATGGSTSVHRHSVVIVDSRCFVAVGDTACCFSLPSLQLEWHIQVDVVTCFGLYYSQKHHGLFSHGEIHITRLTLEGNIQWSVSGKDIFTEGFRLLEDHIEAVDFGNEPYRIEIVSGHIDVLPRT